MKDSGATLIKELIDAIQNNNYETWFLRAIKISVIYEKDELYDIGSSDSCTFDNLFNKTLDTDKPIMKCEYSPCDTGEEFIYIIDFDRNYFSWGFANNILKLNTIPNKIEHLTKLNKLFDVMEIDYIVNIMAEIPHIGNL